jgi:hypothetical protein
MNTYLLVHRHPHEYTGSAETFAEWQAWFKKLGGALIDLGNPVLDGRNTVGSSEKNLALGGYTIVSARNVDEAKRMASTCPIIKEGGAVEIGRLTPIPGREHPARTF